MDSKWRNLAGMLVVRLGSLLLVLLCAGSVRAQSEAPTDEQLQAAQKIEREALEMGPWDLQRQVFEEATDLVFERQGWQSESDTYARELMREVGRVSPWEPQKRQEIFLNGVQVRYGLTHDQREGLDADVRREGMMLTMKHFKSIAPIAMEAMQTRMKGEPFTPEQVQKWSESLKPMMNDGLEVMKRVTGKLSKTMTEDQRQLLEADMQALERRHTDMVKMVEKWERGEWDPRDWGLDRDPIHQAMISERQAADAARTQLVRDAEMAKANLDELAKPREVSAWEKYVIRFCQIHKCSDLQRGQALAILKVAQKEARDYLKAREQEIDKYEAMAKAAETDEKKAYYRDEVSRLTQPVESVFERMCERLASEVLTTEQRSQLEPVKAASAAPKESAPASGDNPAE